IPGSIYSVWGCTIGATISFLLFRYLLRGLVHEKYGKSLISFNKEVKSHGGYYLLSLVLLPITPFGVVTILSGLSDISVTTFIWAVALGTLPGACIYAFAGKQLMNMEKTSDLLSFPLVIALLFLALLALLPIFIRYYKNYTIKKHTK